MDDRIAFQKAINADPTNRTIQLAFADWLEERGDAKHSFWRAGLGGLAGLGRLAGRGGLAGLGRLAGRGGLAGLGRLAGLGGIGGRGGIGGIGGRGGLAGLGGIGGRGGLGRLAGLAGLGGRGGISLNPENPVVLIPGENCLIFMPNGYGFSVFVGCVQKELTHGWIVDPCREILDTTNGDCWVDLAAGRKKLRKACKFGPLIEGGARIPLGCMSIPWVGNLPD